MRILMRKTTESDLEESRGALITLNAPTSLVTDRYRMLFTKIDSLCRKEGKKAVALTSSIKGEGKTTTTANLAVVAARDFGKRSLIIDGDFKSPTISKRFAMVDGPGLAEVIAKKCQLASALKQGPIENLMLLTMGHCLESENSIWATKGIKAIISEVREWFDYVWIDAPPILPVFDMSLISESVDGILVVVRAGETPEPLLAKAIKSLGTSKVIGTVLNRTKMARYDQYGY